MENKDISQIVLERIKESGLKPISKNVFNFKRILFWFLVGFFVVIGAVSFAITLFILFHNDWYLYDKFGFGFVLKSLPYFWAICLLTFTILGEIYYRKTLLGYRHRVVTVVGIYIILTVIIGSFLHLLGMGETIEQSLLKNIPVYRVVVFDRDNFWSQPKEGLLLGKVINKEGNIIKLVDINSTIWNINIENAVVYKQSQVEIGEIIKVLGDLQDNNTVFNAETIYPGGNNINFDCCIVR